MIDSGGTSTGGPMTNGQYSITGGYWALPVAVQSADAPLPTIAPATTGNATISWSPNTPGFVLQETWVLSPSNWSNSPQRRDESHCCPRHVADEVLSVAEVTLITLQREPVHLVFFLC